MKPKKILLFLSFIILVYGMNFLYGQYWENLRNIGNKFKVLIEDISNDAEKIGLTRSRLTTVIELRLRREGIKIINKRTSPKTPLVYISVTVLGDAFNVSLKIIELVNLERVSGDMGAFVITWHSDLIGTHGNNPEYIVASLNNVIDELFNDYYKANPKKKGG